MEEENNTTENQDNIDYIQAINDLKANTVSLEKYNKLKEENKKLLENIITGQTSTEEKVKTRTSKEIKEDLFDGKQKTNLEFVKKALELRNALIKETGEDCFAPSGPQYSPTVDDYAKADLVAEVYQHCIDVAEGDADIFNRELQRCIMNDPVTANMRRR